ncbi:YdaS family helix-turn-helix protein [Pseudoduganella sp. UC29_106]|uniref:YdaS family helix-turn-helix protein n=1 Tax=Pseudoduganella sp. UC29_106 TaxID=3374553 RepID=UPI00375768FD
MSTELKKALDDAGGVPKIAEHFGISTVSVYEWITRGSVPADKCPEIEKFSGGVVRCERLNDKVDWTYLRSTAA